MKLERGEISSTELIYLVACFVQGSESVLALSVKLGRQSNWLVILAALAISIPIALLYTALNQRFPGKNLIQIHNLVYGPYLGKLISMPYLFLFLFSTAAGIQYVAGFLLSYMMPETPLIVFLIMFIIPCAYAVRKGIEVIARASFLLMATTVIIVPITFVLLLKDMNWGNFLPVIEVPLIKFLQGTHVILASSFWGVAAFLMIIPSINKMKQAKSSILLGLLIGGGTLLMVTIRNYATLGILTSITANTSLEAVRLIEIGKIITRMEVLVIIVLLETVFIQVTVFYYAAVLGTAQLLNMKSYRPLVLPFALLAIILVFASLESAGSQSIHGMTIWPVFIFPFQFLLPITTFLIAKIRKLPKIQSGE